MPSEFIEAMQKVENTAHLLAKMGTASIDEAIRRITLISESLERFGDIARIIEHAQVMEENIYACKTLLNLDEAAKYMGMSKSSLYKMTASRQLSYYKPNGRFILFEREELDELMRTNPIYSRKALERLSLAESMKSATEDKKKKDKKK